MYEAKPSILTSVRISPEFYEECKRHKIRFSEAMRVGIAIMLAERGVIEYDNSLNITRLLKEYRRKTGMYAQKAADLENEQGKN